jgi:hypothetical protein
MFLVHPVERMIVFAVQRRNILPPPERDIAEEVGISMDCQTDLPKKKGNTHDPNDSLALTLRYPGSRQDADQTR